MAALAQERRVELDADEEHVEDDADLRQHAEERRDLLRQEERWRRRREAPEQRRSEQDAGQDLADDRRLGEVGEQRADAARDDDDDDQREQHVHERVDVRRGRRRSEQRLSSGGAGAINATPRTRMSQ